MTKSNFWRAATSAVVLEGDAPSRVQSPPKEHSDRMQPGQRILVGDFNEETAAGHVEWVGTIESVSPDGSVTVSWRRDELKLVPTPQGKGYWRHSDWFNFDQEVAARYGLQ